MALDSYWDRGITAREMERYRDELLQYKKQLEDERLRQKRYYYADWGHSNMTVSSQTTTSTANINKFGRSPDKIYYDQYPVDKSPEPVCGTEACTCESCEKDRALKKRNENIKKLFWHRFLASGELPFTSRLIQT